MEAELAAKIRKQAKQLSELSSQLRLSKQYAELVERRLTDIQPHHELPVTSDMIGRALPTASERAAPASLAAAQAKVSELTSQLRAARSKCARAEKDSAAQKKRADALAEKNLALSSRAKRSSGAAGAEGGEGRTASLLASVKVLKRQLAAAESASKDASSNLAQETQAAEEARTYIAVLEHALRNGTPLPPGYTPPKSVQALEQAQHTADDAAASQQRLHQAHADAAVAAEHEVRRLQVREEQLTAALRAVGAPIPATNSPIPLGKSQPGDVVNQLRTEQAALLDYIREKNSTEASLQQQLAGAREAAAKATAQAEASQQEAQAARLAEGAARDAARSSAQQAADAKREAEYASSALKDTRLTGDDAAAQLASKRMELEEAASVQAELLDTIRGLKSQLAASERASTTNSDAAHIAQDKLLSAERALDKAEAAQESAERDVAVLTERLAETQALRRKAEDAAAEATTLASDAQEAADHATADSSQARREVERLRGVEASHTASIASLEARVAALTSEIESLRRVRHTVRAVESTAAELESIASATLSAPHSTAVHESLGQEGGRSDKRGLASQDSDAAAVQSAREAAALAIARAEKTAAWGASEGLSGALPHVAGTVSIMASWLRAAGGSLKSASAFVAAADKDKRAARRLLHEEIHSLRVKLDDASTALASTQRREAELQAELSQLKQRTAAEIGTLSANLHQVRESAGASESDVAALQAELQARKQHGAELSTEVDALMQQLQQAQQAAQSQHSKLESRHEQLQQQGQELAQLSEQLQVTQGRLRVAEDKATRATESKKATEQAAGAERSILLDKNMQLEKSLKDTSRQLNEAQASLADTQAQQGQLSQRLEELKQEHLDLQWHMAKADGEAKEAQGALRSRVDSLEAELGDAVGLLEAQNGKLAAMEADAQASTAERRGLLRSVASLSSESESARDVLQVVTMELARYLDAVQDGASDSSSHGVLASSADKSSSLPAMVTALVARARAVASHAKDVKRGLAASEARATALEHEVTATRPRLSALAEATQGARERAAALVAAEARIGELKGQIASVSSQFEVSREEVTALRGQVGRLQQQLENASARIASLAGEAEGAQVANRSGKQDILRRDDRIRALEEALADARTAAADASHTRSQAEAALGRENGKAAALTADVTRLKATRERLEAALARSQEEVAALREAVSKQHSSHRQQGGEMQQLHEQLHSTQQQLQLAQNALSAHQAERDEVETAVAADLNALSSQGQAAAAERDQLAMRVRDLEASNAQLLQRQEELQEEVAQQRAATHRARSELDAAKDAAHAAQVKLATAEAQYETAQNSLSEMEQEGRQERHRAEQAHVQVEGSREKLAAAQRRIAELQESVAALSHSATAVVSNEMAEFIHRSSTAGGSSSRAVPAYSAPGAAGAWPSTGVGSSGVGSQALVPSAQASRASTPQRSASSDREGTLLRSPGGSIVSISRYGAIRIDVTPSVPADSDEGGAVSSMPPPPPAVRRSPHARTHSSAAPPQHRPVFAHAATSKTVLRELTDSDSPPDTPPKSVAQSLRERLARAKAQFKQAQVLE